MQLVCFLPLYNQHNIVQLVRHSALSLVTRAQRRVAPTGHHHQSTLSTCSSLSAALSLLPYLLCDGRESPQPALLRISIFVRLRLSSLSDSLDGSRVLRPRWQAVVETGEGEVRRLHDRGGKESTCYLHVDFPPHRMLGFSMAPLALCATFLSRPKELDHVSKV